MSDHLTCIAVGTFDRLDDSLSVQLYDVFSIEQERLSFERIKLRAQQFELFNYFVNLFELFVENRFLLSIFLHFRDGLLLQIQKKVAYDSHDFLPNLYNNFESCVMEQVLSSYSESDSTVYPVSTYIPFSLMNSRMPSTFFMQTFLRLLKE